MFKYKLVSTIFFLIILLFSGCGGGNSFGQVNDDNSTNQDDNDTNITITNTGQLLDSAVSGVQYIAGSIDQLTDINGTFEYEIGETVTFKIGKVILGSIAPSNINSDKNVYIPEILGKDRDNSGDIGVIKILQFLQSLDSDGNASNGIDINSSVSNNLGGNDINITSDDFNITQEVDTAGGNLVSQAVAQAHYESTLSTNGISPTTIYKGRLLDSNISGVTYSCADLNGTTDTNGTFSYKYDQNITFKIGGITLGVLNTKNIDVSDRLLFVSELVGLDRNVSTDSKVILLLRLLQSLDSDGDATNGIDINTTVSQGLINYTQDMSIGINEASLGNIINEVNATLVSQNDAIGHYEQTLRDNGMDINTLSALTGYFLDAGVKGVSYISVDTNGTTDINGTFEYKSGQTITFTIGAITLGIFNTSGINSDKKIFITDFVGVDRNDTHNEKVTNILRLLQSLDEDANLSNGIDINSTKIIVDRNISNISEVQLAVVTDQNKTLISKNNSIEHFEDTLRDNSDVNQTTITTYTKNLIYTTGLGITYSSVDINGSTDNNGTFIYKNDENVTFKIGNVTLGVLNTSVISGDKVYISDIVTGDSNDSNSTQVVNILRLLQSLDSDSNVSNGIDINSSIVIPDDLNLSNITDINNTVENNNSRTLVSDINATDEFEKLLRENGIDVDTIAPNAPAYVSSSTTGTTQDISGYLIISGEVNAEVWSAGNKVGDINSTGEKRLTFNLTPEIVNNFSITLKDSHSNESPVYIFTLEHIADPDADKKIKAIDIGYIRDANVTDISDVEAVYVDINNTYTFANSPGYKISLKNGMIKDINLNINIDMFTLTGTVISPITTLLYKDINVKDRLSTVLSVSNDVVNFSKDYIGTNDLNFAKVAQMIYISLKDSNLSTTFINTIKTDDTIVTPSTFGIALENDVNSSSLNNIQKYFSRKFILELNSFNSDVDTMAITLKDTRYSLDGNYTLHKRVVLKTNQTICYDKSNPSNSIVCVDINASGDGNDLFGDDINYTATRTDAINSIVTDNMSNIVWQDNDDNNNTDIIHTWANANQYCLDLNISNITDWKLPTIEELVTITDKNISNGITLNSSFINNISTHYWSSTPYKNISGNYWVIYLDNGMVGYGAPNGEHYVRCIKREE